MTSPPEPPLAPAPPPPPPPPEYTTDGLSVSFSLSLWKARNCATDIAATMRAIHIHVGKSRSVKTPSRSARTPAPTLTANHQLVRTAGTYSERDVRMPKSTTPPE